MPLRPCPTCGAIVPDGRCPRHPRTRGGYRPDRASHAIYRSKTYQRLRLATLTAAAWQCAYCGDRATTADHVIPHSQGGASTPDNLVAACRRCNTSKGARTLTAWIASGCAPQQARATAQQRKKAGLPA